MDPSTLFSVAPTFPMDDARIRDRSREVILRSPATWLPLLAAGTAGILLDGGLTGFVLLVGATVGLVRRYWKKRQSALDAASLNQLIGESNAAQDQELKRIINSLEERGLPQYALCLGRFLLLKQKIESSLHCGPHLAVFAQEVEKGVDGICAEVCREITGIRARETQLGDVLTSRDPERLELLESTRRESHAAILHAYTALYQVHAEILGLASHPAAVTAPSHGIEPPGSRLQEILGGLRDEADMIARTHARIRQTMEESGVASTEAPRQEVAH